MPSTSSLKRSLVGVALAALLAPAGYLATADAATTKTIKLKGVQFSPRSLSIRKGDRVTFRWAGGTHNLIGPRANVAPKSSGTKTVKFTAKGTYKYVCTLHNDMTTTVKVK
ncbi:MAG: blue (type 1) copper domain protein [Solirubrobacterales bacterium]|nr:blue (type 1) copper domain protein [Solirubrobacterales bacterium]